MNTHSHAFFTYAALQTHPQAGLAVVGAAFPDLLFFLAAPVTAALKGIGFREAHTRTHSNPVLHTLVECCHSFLFLGLVTLLMFLVAPDWLMFCWGWLSHLCIDFFTHHQGGHPPLFPLHRWKFKSPISFYEPAQHGYKFMTVEHLVIAGFVVYWSTHGLLTPEKLSWFSSRGALPLMGALASFALLGVFALLHRLIRARLGKIEPFSL